MSKYLRAWGGMRGLRLALGVFIAIQGIQTGHWSFTILGSLLSVMSLLNIGCCGVSGCSTPVKKNENCRTFHR